MALKVEQGLFKADFVDHHAILGIPVDADPKDIRKRYLKIARRLHPDSSMINTEAERQLAHELLSKLVNPAYEKLSQEKEYTEYSLLLKLKGQQALKQQETIALTTDESRKVAQSSNFETLYHAVIKELSEKQYDQLDEALKLIGQISEINLIYLMRREQMGAASSRRPVASAPASSDGSPSEKAAPPPPPVAKKPEYTSTQDLAKAYMRRAEEHEAKQDYKNAILELRDAIELDPKNSQCHARLGVVYLKLNQATMAKIHFKKALDLNPKEAIAVEGLRRVDPQAQASRTASAKQASSKENPPKSKGGFFGIFGGKKK